MIQHRKIIWKNNFTQNHHQAKRRLAYSGLDCRNNCARKCHYRTGFPDGRRAWQNKSGAFAPS